MNWTTILVITAVVAVIFMLKKTGQISAKNARAHLKNGALVIDVRSAAEFKAGHLSEAVNIPLDELPDSLPHSISDKNQVLLLHCLSGTRSGIAKRMLKGMGYTNAFNLGSYNRAQRIVNR